MTATSVSDLYWEAGTGCMDTGSIIPAVLPEPPAAFLDPPAASAFDDLPSKSCRSRMSRAHSIPPTPACADDPRKVMVPRDADCDVDGGYIRLRETESR